MMYYYTTATLTYVWAFITLWVDDLLGITPYANAKSQLNYFPGFVKVPGLF